MTPLEHALVALGRELELPPAPDLVPAVRARLEPRHDRRRLALALAATALVALAAALAVPQARSTIIRFFHLGGVTIERVETLPPAQERPLAQGLGPSLSLPEARDQLQFEPVVPRGIRRVYVRDGALLVLLRERGKPVLLTEFAGGFIKKVVSGETRVEEVHVGADYGFWIAGARHVFQMPADAPRMAGNTLLWEHVGLTLRLEGHLTKAQAIKLAYRIVLQ